jgi:hypothetical protein
VISEKVFHPKYPTVQKPTRLLSHVVKCIVLKCVKPLIGYFFGLGGEEAREERKMAALFLLQDSHECINECVTL